MVSGSEEVGKNMSEDGLGKRRRGRPPKQDSEPASTVKALDKGIAVLNLLSKSKGQVLTDLALEAGMPMSTTHRMLVTLLKHEFVRFNAETDRWSIGPRLFEIGQSFAQSRDVISVSRPRMHALMLESGETVSLALADREEVIFVAQVETEASIRAFFPPGERGPLHASGCGKAIIATWPDQQIIGTLNRLGMQKFTDRTIITLAGFMDEVAKIRQHGWSTNDGEHTSGMRCAAAPIFDATGRAIAAMSISGPSDRVPYSALPSLGELIRYAAKEITMVLGGQTTFFDSSSL